MNKVKVLGIISIIFASIQNPHLCAAPIHSLIIGYIPQTEAAKLKAIKGLFITAPTAGLKKKLANSIDKQGKSPLHYALQNGFLTIANFLIEKKANVNIEDRKKSTPLHYAIMYAQGDYDIINTLQQHGANLNAQTINGDSPLHIAANWGKIDIAKFLIQKGAIIDIKNTSGKTPLHNAILEHNVDLVSFFLEKGVNIHAQDNAGNSSLFMAAKEGRIDIAKLLVQKGAIIDIKNTSGETPLQRSIDNLRFYDIRYSKQRPDEEIELIYFLIEKGANVHITLKDRNSPLHTAAKKNLEKLVIKLLNKGLNIDAKNAQGQTPLYVAAADIGEGYMSDYLIMVKLLVAKGANVHIKLKNGDTLLHLATNDEELLRTLIKKGLNVNEQNLEGNTALHIAAGQNLATPQILIELGADQYIKNNKGETPASIREKVLKKYEKYR